MSRKSVLNEGWLFRRLPEQTIEQTSPALLPVEGYETVTLPHTWYTDEDPYRGLTVYRRTVCPSPEAEHVFLSFEGADQRCRVWAYGVLLGEHRGGYSRFRVPLPRSASGRTEITVLLDNRVDETVSPHFGDFTVFGGLYRPVELIEAGECCFDYGYYGTDGLIVRASADEGGDGLLRLEPHVLGADTSVRIRYVVLDEDGNTAAEAFGPADETLSLHLGAVRLWGGPGRAHLYTVRAALMRGDEVLDEVSVRTGFCRVTLRAEDSLCLNGRKTPLRGVAKHQDIGLSYNAVSDAQIAADFALIGEIGANAVRLSHYQHAQKAYDEADERALLCWAEIPMLKMTEDSALFENAKDQLRELILQNIHHPSIFCWGIQNEIAMFRDAPYMHEQCAALHAIVKELDPDRLSACANLYPLKPKSRLNRLTDLVGYNLYFGWYYGEPGDYATYLDRFHAAAPDVCLGVSEYGVDANIALHNDAPQIKDYSEEYQALWHETVYPQIEARPWLWGSFVWNMFDFSSARRDEGGLRFVNGKGLVTRDRQIKKDSFFYYKARWSDKPFVHLCARRFEKRCCERADVKVYTNRREVSLTVNDVLFASGENDGNGTVLFRGVPLVPGENRVEASSGAYTDALVWQRVETPEAGYALPETDGGAVKNWFLSDDDITRQGYFSLNDTANDVLDDPKARAVLEKHVPALTRIMLTTDSIPLGLSVKDILSYGRTDDVGETLRAVNRELNEIENLF